MIEMVRRFLRQKFGSAGVVVTLALLALLAAMPLNAQQSIGFSSILGLLVIAGGCVSRDVASGALQMILARPIRRTDYLAGRYVGILVAQILFLVGCVAVAAALDETVARLLPAASGGRFSLPAAGRIAAEALFESALIAAIVLFFSTFLRGWGDVLALALSAILLGSMQALGQALGLPQIARAGDLVRQNLAPSVPWELVLRGQSVLGEATGRYLLALAVFWILAAVVFSRREFSYGQD